MSATSGNEATTRSTAAAGAGKSQRRTAQHAAAQKSTSREAMGVTPAECGPLQREALVVARVGQVHLVELEAQAVELRREPGGEGRVRALPIRVAEGGLGVVPAQAQRVAAAEERLEVRVAAVSMRALVAQDRVS